MFCQCNYMELLITLKKIFLIFTSVLVNLVNLVNVFVYILYICVKYSVYKKRLGYNRQEQEQTKQKSHFIT